MRMESQVNKQPSIGHNITAAKAELASIIDRIEAQETEIREFQKNRAEIYLEAKGRGYDVKALKAIVRMRKQGADERAEQAAILEMYMAALDMI